MKREEQREEGQRREQEAREGEESKREPRRRYEFSARGEPRVEQIPDVVAKRVVDPC